MAVFKVIVLVICSPLFQLTTKKCLIFVVGNEAKFFENTLRGVILPYQS